MHRVSFVSKREAATDAKMGDTRLQIHWFDSQAHYETKGNISPHSLSSFITYAPCRRQCPSPARRLRSDDVCCLLSEPEEVTPSERVGGPALATRSDRKATSLTELLHRPVSLVSGKTGSFLATSPASSPSSSSALASTPNLI